MKRKNSLSLFQEWQRRNCPTNALFVANMGLFVSSIMIFFDYLFLTDSLHFIQIRFICIGTMLPIQILAHRNLATAFNKRFQQSILILSTIFIFNISYFYFCYFCINEKQGVYYAGLLLTTFISTFMLHRFPKEQYIYSIFFAGAAVTLSFILPTYRDSLYIVIILHLSSSFLAEYFRKQFITGLNSQFTLLKTMVPEKVASYIISGSEQISENKSFAPKSRFSVCLCADWRGFQKLTAHKKPEEISIMLEKYYDIILAGLEKSMPEKNYYFNWNADELFLVFFNDSDDEKSCMTDGLLFAFQLCNDIYDQVKKEFKDEVVYDVGISSGVGYIGLVGPKEMKKTTIHGEVAGRAKRFEQEAKLIRKTEGRAPPRMVMDQKLFGFSTLLKLGADGAFEIRQAKTADIKNENVFVWRPGVVAVKPKKVA